MIKKGVCIVCFFLVFTNGFSWGFFAHKAINRLAVFTLPEELLGFYKTHIEYLTEHAVDPDKRRYSDSLEACRHYMDVDHYESVAPIDTIPVYWKHAVARYSEDTLLAYGIVPWHITRMMFRLTDAWKEKNAGLILHYSAEIGHYIADACVPLHATMNYNGQLTGQHGIHGFWESRLPELFNDQYDFFVGRAEYVYDVQRTIWRAVEGSFAAKDSVLDFERKLNATFPTDRKYSLESKGYASIKTYSEGYASHYHDLLQGQVERRMRLAIQLVGSLWYTAWVDAGQPDFKDLKVVPLKLTDADQKQIKVEESKLKEQKMIGRGE